jgi:hypothetical protein
MGASPGCASPESRPSRLWASRPGQRLRKPDRHAFAHTALDRKPASDRDILTCTMRLTLAVVFAMLSASTAAHAPPAQTCPPSTNAWMPTGEEMAAACSFEPLFKEPIAEIGTEHSCHYALGKLAGLAGLDVTQDSQKSADAAAREAVATYAQLPGYSGTAKNIPRRA